MGVSAEGTHSFEYGTISQPFGWYVAASGTLYASTVATNEAYFSGGIDRDSRVVVEFDLTDPEHRRVQLSMISDKPPAKRSAGEAVSYISGRWVDIPAEAPPLRIAVLTSNSEVSLRRLPKNWRSVYRHEK